MNKLTVYAKLQKSHTESFASRKDEVASKKAERAASRVAHYHRRFCVPFMYLSESPKALIGDPSSKCAVDPP
jgi:hypothetical protein